jgi:hypothetical protein
MRIMREIAAVAPRRILRLRSAEPVELRGAGNQAELRSGCLSKVLSRVEHHDHFN